MTFQYGVLSIFYYSLYHHIALWLIVWHYDRIALYTMVMIMLLTTLVLISKLTIGLTIIEHTTFSLYLGWITAAKLCHIVPTL